MTFLAFARSVSAWVRRWDNHKLTRAQLERSLQWWKESNNCCPEAAAMDLRFIYPQSAREMR